MLPKRKIIEVFEELSPQDNGYWAVPDGVYEVEFALVAGGLNGEYTITTYIRKSRCYI